MYIFENWSEEGMFIRVVNATNTVHLDFPFSWDGDKRAFTYRCFNAPEPMIRTQVFAVFRETRMDLATFTEWMNELNTLDENLEPPNIDDSLGDRWPKLLAKHEV